MIKRILPILCLLFLPMFLSANITIVASVSGAATNAERKNYTTPAISTTGSNLICVAVADFQGGAAGTLTDNAGNTWTLIRSNNDGAISRIRVYYCNAPTTSGTHTFNYTSAADVYPAIFVYALAGTKTTGPLDQQAGQGNASATSGTAGSITPGADGSIVLSFCNSVGNVTFPNAPTLNTPTSFTAMGPQNWSVNAHFACNSAYWIQAAATATNQQWNYQSSFTSTVVQVSFQPQTYTPIVVSTGGAMMWWMNY